jgi:divalent metal cation (Fe/Co/Zn/Cd) transporter
MTDRKQLVKQALNVEILTLVAVAIEGIGALYFGHLAGSLLLIAFGIDSGIEWITSIALTWRFFVEWRGGDTARADRAEHISHKIVAYCLVALCCYVALSSAWGLIAHISPDNSPWGIAISLFAVVVMPYLWWRKSSLAQQLQSNALKGDAVCSATCAVMAAIVLVGLLLTCFFGWWWVQHIMGFVFLVWLIKETKASFEEGHQH